jgi:glycosyltransferase involved in cell wall biosynthesis
VRIAYVTHRYGPEIRGGAEQAVRLLAEHLAAARTWRVEVFTTGARDGTDWADQFPAGSSEVGGVTVHRFHSSAGRDPDFQAISDRVLPHPASASLAEQHRWVDQQGPITPDLLDGVAATPADLVVFCPYLYWPTVRGVPRFADRAVVHPAAHDEAPFRLAVIAPVFTAPRGLAYFSDAERRLVEARFPLGAKPAAVIGLGVEGGHGSEEAFRASAGVGDRPYVLCLGRVDAGKGATLLARFFASYKTHHPGDLALVFVGPVVDSPPPHPDIFITGAVDEGLKWGAMHGAQVFVSPSPHESFSIVLMEAWTAGVPVMVNGRCDVTVDHSRRSGGGLWFDDYATFEVGLDKLLGDPDLAAELGGAGRTYVEREYTWPVVSERYARFLESLA